MVKKTNTVLVADADLAADADPSTKLPTAPAVSDSDERLSLAVAPATKEEFSAQSPTAGPVPWGADERRVSRRIFLRDLPIGGDAPIAVQSMLNAPAEDFQANCRQLRELEEAGAELVRMACPNEASIEVLRQLVRVAQVPLIADIHFHYKRAIEAAEAGAACLRINPGNIGSDERVAAIVAAAKAHGAAMRIGVNAGSLEPALLAKYRRPCPEALVASALHHMEILERHAFRNYKVSIKASDPFLTAAATEQLARLTDCPLHIGITEAGSFYPGLVKSAVGLGRLLWAGIGDTLRVSLSAAPQEEVKAGFEILKALGLRRRGVTIISCPSCARQGFDVIGVVQELEQRLAHIRAPITLSLIGCVVNGPGEARQADFGFTGGGAGRGRVYIAGRLDRTLSHDEIVEHFAALVERKAAAWARDARA